MGEYAAYRTRTCSTTPDNQQLAQADAQIDAQTFGEGLDVGEVMASWPELPYACRAGILALVRAFKTGGSPVENHLDRGNSARSKKPNNRKEKQ
jgi:hypothetical protein